MNIIGSFFVTYNNLRVLDQKCVIQELIAIEK
jgi:hypothetical protein